MKMSLATALALAVSGGAAAAEQLDASPIERPIHAQVGKPAPGFDLPRLQGTEPGNLAQLRGRVVLIEFWASYCGWCKSTHPQLAQLASRHPRELAVLGISAQGKRRLTRYLARNRLGFTALRDPRRRVSRRYGARATPTVVVIDRAGVVRFAGVGVPAVRKAVALADRLAANE